MSEFDSALMDIGAALNEDDLRKQKFLDGTFNTEDAIIQGKVHGDQQYLDGQSKMMGLDMSGNDFNIDPNSQEGDLYAGKKIKLQPKTKVITPFNKKTMGTNGIDAWDLKTGRYVSNTVIPKGYVTKEIDKSVPVLTDAQRNYSDWSTTGGSTSGEAIRSDIYGKKADIESYIRRKQKGIGGFGN